MIQRALQQFHPRQQPWMTRQSYSHELRSVMTFPLAMALVEGGVVGVLAKKAFDAPPVLYALIMAAPMFANVSSFGWAHLAHGRPKVRFINALQVALLIVVAAIALLPTVSPGPVLLAVLMIAARCLIAGIVTMRTTVWRMNYPRAIRARLTSQLVLIHMGIVAAAPLAGYFALDLNVNAFRWIYPLGAAIALTGVIAYSRIRLRGEKELLRHENRPARRVGPHGETGPVYENTLDDAPSHRQTVLGVLRGDARFRRYLACQFISGTGMQMSEVAVVFLIAERMTEGLRFEYLTSIALTTAIPMGVAMACMPLFARYLDRVHVAAFRVYQAKWWIATQAITFIGAWLAFQGQAWAVMALIVMALARLLLGVTRGAGALAFNLGHHDFAGRRDATLYMGLNVTLAGVRGVVASLLGMALYLGWRSRALGPVTLPAFDGVGPYLFLLTTVLLFAGLLGFYSLHKQIERATVAGEA